MSFSSEVKEELSRHLPTARHCQIAETAAILSLCGQISEKDGTIHIFHSCLMLHVKAELAIHGFELIA